MKTIIYTLLLAISPFFLSAQKSSEIIQSVRDQQKRINYLSYDLKRTDTIGNVIRHMNGRAIYEKNVLDTVFGFKFWAEKEGDPISKFYDGKVGYSIDKLGKTYETTISNSGFKNLLMGGGGHMIVPDLIKLNTNGASKIELKEEEKHFILKIIYPDLDQYDVTNRFKEIYVDKITFLPNSVREHQESYKRIQDLYYEITNVKIDKDADRYNFSKPEFLARYNHLIPQKTKNPIYDLIGKAMPSFKLKDFKNNWFDSENFKNKVVLLDFWEVWCGPCIESMPKIETLHNKYASKGLLILGVVNDPENIEASRNIIKKSALSFPTLIGNEKIKQAFKLNTIPLYMLVDRKGTIIFISEGYSEIIEEAILKALD